MRRVMPAGRRAFTLVELLVVIAIVGLLSTVAVIAASSQRDKARLARGLQYEGQIYRALGDDTVARWELDDCSGTTASDASGYGYNGTLSSGAAWSTNTAFGKGCSVSLDGVSGAVAIPYQSISATALSYSAWFNTASAASLTVLSFRSTLVRVSATGIDWWPNTNVGRATANTPISSNVWHHIVVDQNGTAYSIYLDGGLVGSGTAAAINNANRSNSIGSYNGGTYFNGLIDNVRVYSRSLTSREAWRIYAEGALKHRGI